MIKQDVYSFWEIFDEEIGFRLFPAIKSQNVSLGYDQDGLRAMYVDLPKGIKIIEPSYNLEYLSFTITEGDHNYLVITLKDQGFTDLFNEFIYTIFFQIMDLTDIKLVVSRVVELYHEWSLFFTKEARTNIKLKKILGLAGELYYIINYFKYFKSLAEVIECWEGPSNSTHDFIFLDHDLEVKSKLETSNVIHISSLFQLEFDKSLRLGVVSFTKWDEELDEIPMSINQMIDIILEKLKENGVHYIHFLNKLLQLGINYFDNEQMDELIEVKFIINGHQDYDASHNDFPRLSTENIPSAIKKIKYDLDLNQIEEFKL